MESKRLLEKYNIDLTGFEYEQYFKKAEELYKTHGNEIMEFEKYDLFSPELTSRIAEIRDELAKDPDNVLYSYFLYTLLADNQPEPVRIVGAPNAMLKDEKYDTLPVFALCHCVPSFTELYSQKGVSDEIIVDTLSVFETQVRSFMKLYKRIGISNYVGWILRFLRGDIIKIGRLNFELYTYKMPFDFYENNGKITALPNGVNFHKSGYVLGSKDCTDTEGSYYGEIVETDDYYEGLRTENGKVYNEKVRLYKNEWRRVLRTGERVINIHIPNGGKMPHEVVGVDLQRGREFIKEHFEDIDVIYATSWLLDPQIKTLMGKETNLTKFIDRFICLAPFKSDATALFPYVFGIKEIPPYEELPETSSFGKAVKDHLISGGNIYGAFGIIL